MRWKPTRAGIFNVWEYDDQTFEFGDGRLALRGRNGSGKSNALALLFPFVFDGVMSAARMDPMGGGRSMKSLLLGRDDDDRAGRYRHDSGTGYVWMEFGDGENYTTIGVGAAATQHRDAEPWFFVTTQRVGHDLSLADNDTPLGRRQLEERLTDGNVYTKADDYRLAVDRRLLGLGDRRYRRLVDLLLTLRRPHLAGKLDTEHLSATLSAGLGELDPALIADVAHSFDDLDAMQHELEGLVASLAAVERFVPTYRDHLVAAARQRAQALVDTSGAVRELDREFDRTRKQFHTAGTSKDGLTTKVAETDAAIERLGADIENIRDSPAYQDATALNEVRKSADNAKRVAEQTAETSRTSTADAAVAVEKANGAREEAEVRDAAVADAVGAWTDTARLAGIDVAVGGDLDDAWAISVVTQRRGEVGEVKRLARQATDAADRARHAERHEGETRERAEDAARELVGAREHLADERSGLAEHRSRWAANLADTADTLRSLAPDHEFPNVDLPWGHTASPADAVDEAADADIQAFHVADRLVGEFDLATARLLDAAAAAVAARRDEVGALIDERHRVETEPNPGPPANPTRPDAGGEGLAGVPLYVCVDFADHVDTEARAGLEAALGAAGILDARVAPDDGPRDALDAMLLPEWAHDASGPSLADVLVPVPVDGLASGRIAAVLQAIPLASDVMAIHTDGTWRLGPLAGRFVQPQPEFIGYAARERRRAERLAVLDATIANQQATLDRLVERRSQIQSARDVLTGTRAKQPPVASLASALAEFRNRSGVLDERRRSHASAKADAEAKLRAADAASIDLQRAATRLRLPGDTESLVGVEDLLRDCDAHRRNVASVRNTLTIALRAAAQAAETAQKMLDRAAGDQTAAERAAAFAEAEQSRYEQLRANVGGDAERAVEALARARDLRMEHESLARQLAEELRIVDGTLATLEERLAGFDKQRITLEADLVSARQRFGVICSAEIADVVAVEGVEPGGDPLAGARRLLAATEPPTDDVFNRMERAYREILLDGLRAGHDPSMPKVDGIDVVRVGTVDGDLPIGSLARQLRDEYERTSQLLTKQEREIFETHLLTRVGDALRQLLLDADAFEHRINEEMSKVPTESGMIVELRWETTGDEPGLRDAIQALRTAPEMLGPDRRDSLREFFMQRIADVRASGPGQSFTETLTAVLDYRAWHQFALYARFSTGKRQRVTRTFYRGLSGGEAATLLHLPLFAAAGAQYGNGTVDGPRIIALDEAFVGIDDKMRSRLMGLLTQLDLDVILTSHEFWGFYETVPSLVLYDLVRRPPTPGVYAQRFDWTSDVSTLDD
ncbi:MAG TPA: TIGR02680 family protein [Ilumatobacter sp.]|nr:TIGR02680 family protein [Ilumatobacter sp.]